MLRTNAEQIASYLMNAAGACACYLALVGNAGQRPRIIVAAGDQEYILNGTAEIAPLLRRTRGRSQPIQTVVHDMPTLAMSLQYEERHVGAILLVYADEAAIDADRAIAVAKLAGHTLDAARQIAALHLRAEEIEERARIREIQVSRNLIRGIIDAIPIGLALIDPDGTVLAANRALSERFDLEPAALVGMSYSSVLGVWEKSPAAQIFTGDASKRVRRNVTRPDGAQMLMEVTGFPLLDADERPRQVVEVWEDITERVALQTQLVRAERLAAIGQLAASIAHEVGNPLQAIQGFLVLFLEQCAEDTPNRNFLELADEEIERIVQVVARLRDLYRPRADVVTAVNINDLLQSVLLLTGKQLERSRVNVQHDFEPALPSIQGVADQLKQVLLNLVLNAAEAMPDGGVLKIRTSSRASGMEPGSVVVEITDDGIGIAPDRLPYIFDGLHTTKERGMGLGLYTSKAIIERHMGRVSVQSTYGEGTTFAITLPIEAEENQL